jgi:signal transduction histidine kinase
VVSDNGPGVAPDELPRLFDRFHRGTAARESGVPGFGLGLAISRAVIERQGGSIAVESAAGGGARFSIRLPLAG